MQVISRILCAVNVLNQCMCDYVCYELSIKCQYGLHFIHLALNRGVMWDIWRVHMVPIVNHIDKACPDIFLDLEKKDISKFKVFTEITCNNVLEGTIFKKIGTTATDVIQAQNIQTQIRYTTHSLYIALIFLCITDKGHPIIRP